MNDELSEDKLGVDLATRLRRFEELRQVRDEANAAAAAREKEYREMEQEVWEALDASDLNPPYNIDGIKFGLGETHYGRIIDQEAALEHFESRAMTDELTRPAIQKGRLNEIVREHIEQRVPLPPGVDFYTRRYVKITRPKT